MPIVTVNLLVGRDKETKTQLIRNVCAAVTETLGVPPESVRIMLNEIAVENYGIAGQPVLEYRAQKSKK